MKGIEFGEVRDAVTRAFSPDEFDLFLFERLDFNRQDVVADGPFRIVVANVLKYAMQEGWDPILIAEVARARPLKQDVQDVYQKYAQALVDETRQQAVEAKRLEALQRFGLAPRVNLQTAGAAQLPAAAPATDTTFEKTVRSRLPMLDIGLWRERLFKLEGRVCRVEVGNGAMGTGFLVGPDTLLTNYHVLRDVLDGTAPANAVRCRFDYRVLANGAESEGVLVALHPTDWKVDHSPYTAGEAANRPDEVPATPDELDHALVKLARPIGGEPLNPANPGGAARGWVAVPAAAQPLAPHAPLLILQHPNAAPLKLALDTDGVLQVKPTRVRYATNTEPGSSGSPCFDLGWNLVALHHYGDPAFNHPPGYNQGIPVGTIRERLRRVGKEAALGGACP